MPGNLTVQFAQYLERQGMRLTSQRRIIAEAFFQQDGHPSVEDIYFGVRRDHPTIGQATVYRTLKLLQDSGLAQASRFGGETTRFEAADHDDHHDHLVCTRCGRIVEFLHPGIERAQDSVAKAFGFRLEDHKQELYGVPEVCLVAKECAYAPEDYEDVSFE